MIIAILDACVLYPPSLRDLFMRLATSGVYAPRWSSTIQEEWVRNVLADNTSITLDQLERTCRLMEQVDSDSVVTGFEVHISALQLPDPDDRHVLAAAIHASASRIVTYNLYDFPAAALAEHNIKAVHPDIFLSALVDDDPELFLLTMRRHRQALRSPPKSIHEYIDTLKVNGLTDLALRVEAYRDEI